MKASFLIVIAFVMTFATSPNVSKEVASKCHKPGTFPQLHIYQPYRLKPPIRYNFACTPLAFFKIGSILVAFITFPVTFKSPFMNKLCAFAFPLTNSPKCLSLILSVVVAFLGGLPLPTVPDSLRSMYHDSVLPSVFLSSKAKMALPWDMASLREASSVERAVAMCWKASEEGWESGDGELAVGLVVWAHGSWSSELMDVNRADSCR
jgi:hypothetical protein